MTTPFGCRPENSQAAGFHAATPPHSTGHVAAQTISATTLRIEGGPNARRGNTGKAVFGEWRRTHPAHQPIGDAARGRPCRGGRRGSAIRPKEAIRSVGSAAGQHWHVAGPQIVRTSSILHGIRVFVRLNLVGIGVEGQLRHRARTAQEKSSRGAYEGARMAWWQNTRRHSKHTSDKHRGVKLSFVICWGAGTAMSFIWPPSSLTCRAECDVPLKYNVTVGSPAIRRVSMRLAP